MPNFFTDNEDIQFHFANMDLDEIIRLREDDFKNNDNSPYAPENVEDARDSYRRTLEMLGEMCAEFIAPKAPDIDEQGSLLNDGRVTYAKGISESVEMLSKADLMGFTLPRKYGGLNMPTAIYVIAIELVSRADASLMTIFGLQDIAETINDYADEEIKREHLPKFSSGEVTGAMVLTEPDAGSDLQAVQLKATEDPENGCWRLNGVKRFITNGCGDILLVLARSEEGTTDARGLSLFLCESKDGVRVRRIEDKMGIHGSPTCELYFQDVPAKLIGQRKRGLIRYVMSLMNGARIAIATQSLGIAEAAYNEALEFAREREQFGKKIKDIPAVAEMLVNMRIGIEASRALLYDAARAVDMYQGLEKKSQTLGAEQRSLQRDIKKRVNSYRKLASILTPMCKYYICEMSLRVTSDAIQIHGGSGYMRDYNVERYFRDARITNIYEGTSQLQVVAILAGLLGGELNEKLSQFAGEDYGEMRSLAEKVNAAKGKLDKCVGYVKEKKDSDYTDLYGRRLSDIACDVYISYLLLEDAKLSDRKKVVAEKFINDMVPRVNMNTEYVFSDDKIIVENLDILVGQS